MRKGEPLPSADLNDCQPQSQSFEQLAAHRGSGFTLTGAADPEVHQMRVEPLLALRREKR